MVAFSKINVGDILYDCHRTKQGNTRTSRMGCWSVRIISIDSVKYTAQASWNGNTPRIYHERDIKRLRRSPLKDKAPALCSHDGSGQ